MSVVDRASESNERASEVGDDGERRASKAGQGRRKRRPCQAAPGHLKHVTLAGRPSRHRGWSWTMEHLPVAGQGAGAGWLRQQRGISKGVCECVSRRRGRGRSGLKAHALYYPTDYD
ncbi:hypothetical protein H113_04859 [Trichophyton rubrum MR1459]|nr:hypothetical protein H113_04859 [Trichophyton rubrum MR1459]EZG00643.1 hypothetical protein H106_08879 [Trichophyton rubrum CBS 735.88]